MIEVKIDGLRPMDYISPSGGWNYEAIDSLAKELCDRLREAEAEQILKEFKKYIENQHSDNMVILNQLRAQLNNIATHRYLITPFDKGHSRGTNERNRFEYILGDR